MVVSASLNHREYQYGAFGYAQAPQENVRWLSKNVRWLSVAETTAMKITNIKNTIRTFKTTKERFDAGFVNRKNKG